MLPGIYGERSHLEVSGWLKMDSTKTHVPEWLSERLAGGAVEVLEHDDPDELADEVVPEEPTEDEPDIPDNATTH